MVKGKNNTPTCPYCNRKANLVTGKTIYPHRPDLYSKNFYYCDNGHNPAYVGCHKGTTKPLGRLADGRLRHAKSDAHKAFDPLWKDGYMSRGRAYKWLSKCLGVDQKDCHIGMFDVSQCKKVVDVANIKMVSLIGRKVLGF